jgi:hypothetical protein
VAKGKKMTGDIKVEASVREGSVELQASYPEYAIIDAGFDEPFRKQLVEKYESLAQTQTNRDCILSITARVAGSQVVKGIFELYKVVRARSGILICANYPPEYVRALSDIGLPSLPGFELCSSLEEARTKMEKLRLEAGA